MDIMKVGLQDDGSFLLEIGQYEITVQQMMVAENPNEHFYMYNVFNKVSKVTELQDVQLLACVTYSVKSTEMLRNMDQIQAKLSGIFTG